MNAPATATTPQRKKILHVGCGTAPLPAPLVAAGWEEIRYDIDPAVRPHVVGSMLDMGVLADGSVDALYSSHNVEHLEAHEVAIALGEFRRVLKPGGTAWILVPDLQVLAERLAEGDVEGELYVSASGPISVSDMLWGHRASLSAGQKYMAHRFGFSAATLQRHLGDAGFGPVKVERQLARRELLATATRPPDPVADVDQLFEQARRLHNAGRWADARHVYTQVARARPRFWPAQLELGAIHFLTGSTATAIEHAQRAVALEPKFPRSHLVLGQLYAAAGRPAEALQALQRAAELDPSSAVTQLELARVLQERQAWVAAEAACRQALRLQPSLAAAGVRLARIVAEQGRLGEAVDLCRAALAGTEDPRLHAQLLPLLAAQDEADPGGLRQAADALDQRFAPTLAARLQPPVAPPDPNRRLRVGYLSAHFQRHPMRHAILPLLQGHDRASFEVWCYHDSPRLDDVTAMYRSAASHWVSCHALGDAALAERIRADGIDVLVDLSGGGDTPRRLVLARQPAPVQLVHPAFGAWPATTGTAGLMVDRWLQATPGVPDEVLLPGPALVHLPAPGLPAVTPSPFERHGVVTFGVVAPALRLGSRLLRNLAQVMQAVPDARLCIQCSALQVPAVQQRLAAELQQQGVPPQRLQLRAWADASPDLAVFHEIDILIDTPLNGLATTGEALSMGVPVLTCAGPSPAHRLGASLLHAAGLGDWVAGDPQGLVQRAQALAGDRNGLRHWRQQLRQHLAGSTLTDAAAHARVVEAGYRSAWQRWCSAASTTNL